MLHHVADAARTDAADSLFDFHQWGIATNKPEFDGEWVRLGDVCEIVNGATPRTEVPEYWGGDIKWVTPAELRNEIHTVFDTAKHLTKAGFESASLRMMPAGTILLTTRAPIGKLALAGDEMCCNQGFKCLICPETVNNEWLCRLLKHRVPELQAMGTGATFKELSKRAISDYKICVPPMEAQIDIVKKLTKLDEVLANCRALLSALDDLVKSRFVEMFGDVRTNPHRFEKCCLRDVARGKLSYGSSCSSVPYDGMTRYLRITDITDDGSLNDDVRSPSDVSDKYLLNDGDLLFARSGATVGKTYRYKKDDGRAIYAGYLIRLVPNTDLVLPDYLFWYTKTDFYSSFVANAQRAVAQPNINAQEYASLELLVPPLDDQRRFVSFATRVDKLGFDCCRMTTYCDTVFSSVSARLLCT